MITGGFWRCSRTCAPPADSRRQRFSGVQQGYRSGPVSRGGPHRVVLIGGWAPHRHVGDDAILRVHLEALADADLGIEPVVLGADPHVLADRFGVRAAPNLERFLFSEATDRSLTEKLATLLNAAQGRSPAPDHPHVQSVLGLLDGAHALICLGAGSLASKYRTVLLTQAVTVQMACDAGVSVAVCGVSLGPVTSAMDAIALRRLLRCADLVVVRDRVASVAEAQALGRRDVVCDWDPAAWLRPDLRVPFDVPGDIAMLCADGETAPICRAAVDALFRAGTVSIGVPMDFFAPASDVSALSELAGGLAHPDGLRVLDPVPDDQVILGLAARARVVFGSRYHAAVFAASQGTPAVLVHWDAYTRRKAEGLADLEGPIVRAVSAEAGPEAICDAVLAQVQRPRQMAKERAEPLPAIQWLRGLR
jgi:colanic acid/amylovoran biosynthesis protein